MFLLGRCPVLRRHVLVLHGTGRNYGLVGNVPRLGDSTGGGAALLHRFWLRSALGGLVSSAVGTREHFLHENCVLARGVH